MIFHFIGAIILLVMPIWFVLFGQI